MSGEREARREAIRRFILEQAEKQGKDIVRATAERFGITRQAVNKHIKPLVDQGLLVPVGATRTRRYLLSVLSQQLFTLNLSGLEEHVVWRSQVEPHLRDLAANVIDIWHYGFTEMLNNAIDHSEGATVAIELKRTATRTVVAIADDGVGIFRKIQAALGLEDERHAVLELTKGKLTTDPERHTGEGIFFTSRVFDEFAILSGGVYLSHRYGEHEDWIIEQDRVTEGTGVFLVLDNNAQRSVEQVFNQFTSEEEDFGFTKTVVPVHLVKYGNERLVSRSQAKRLLARVDRFKTVLLDFSGVESIGQAFADEIFRVFRKQHPEVAILPCNTNEAVERMINRALGANGNGGSGGKSS